MSIETAPETAPKTVPKTVTEDQPAAAYTAPHSKVSVTAKMVAYMRQFSDIRFAKDVAQFLTGDGEFEEFLKDKSMAVEDMGWFAPILEVRYKSIAHLIEKSGIKQVLEIASGLSLRGLAMASTTGLTYVDSDLPGLTAEKDGLIRDVRAANHLSATPTYHSVVANALNIDELNKCLDHFTPGQPLAIVNEGLIPYFSPAERDTFARNVLAVLKEFGGVWITPDFATKIDGSDFADKHRQLRDMVDRVTQRPLFGSAFETDELMMTYFRDFGFDVKISNQIDETPKVTSIEALNLSPTVLEEMRPRLRIFTLSPAADKNTTTDNDH